MIDVRGHKVENDPANMTLAQWEKVIVIKEAGVFNPDQPEKPYKYKSNIAKYYDIFKTLGLPEAVLNELMYEDEEELLKHVRAFNDFESSIEVTAEIEINGYTYRALDADGNFKFSPKDREKCEEFIRKDPEYCIGEIMAVIFKRTDLTRAEHFADAHIKEKAKVFRKEMSGAVSIPYLLEMSKKMYKQMQAEAAEQETDPENETAE